MLKKAAALFLVCASVATWVSCGSTSSRYVYASIPGSNEIVAYREDPNSGVLTQLAGSPITAGQAVQAIVIHPSKKFLYAANSGEGDISLFTISTTGILTEVTPRTSITPDGTAPTLLAMDAAGAFLYVGNAGSNNISVFSIDSGTGALTQVGNAFPIGTNPLNMQVVAIRKCSLCHGWRRTAWHRIHRSLHGQSGSSDSGSELAIPHGNESGWTGHRIERQLSVHREQAGQFHLGICDQCRRVSHRAVGFANRRAIRRTACAFDRQVWQISVRRQSSFYESCGILNRFRWHAHAVDEFAVWHWDESQCDRHRLKRQISVCRQPTGVRRGDRVVQSGRQHRNAHRSRHLLSAGKPDLDRDHALVLFDGAVTYDPPTRTLHTCVGALRPANESGTGAASGFMSCATRCILHCR